MQPVTATYGVSILVRLHRLPELIRVHENGTRRRGRHADEGQDGWYSAHVALQRDYARNSGSSTRVLGREG